MKLKIVNAKGLHARASAKFSETCEKFDAKATVLFDGMSAAGDSIMGLMMLGAAYGSEIEVEVEGAQKDELESALHELVEDYFGEGG
jgi:phosphocarrier protein HPr